MIKEAIGIADTVEAAKEKAMAELNVSFDDDFQVEVIALPKKKTLGLFGGSKAEVKVSVEVPDPKPAKAPKAKKSNRNDEKKAEKAPKAEKAEAKKKAEPVVPQGVPAAEVPADSPAGKGAKYLATVLEKLGCDNVQITVAEIEGGAQFTLTGEGLGVVIGHRGETLDALQYLTMLVANRGEGEYQRITLNIGDYREKRERTLRSLARRMANQALKQGRNMTLEPMNPYERRIIHTAVQDVKGVTSWSVGDEPNRRVVIEYVR